MNVVFFVWKVIIVFVFVKWVVEVKYSGFLVFEYYSCFFFFDVVCFLFILLNSIFRKNIERGKNIK